MLPWDLPGEFYLWTEPIIDRIASASESCDCLGFPQTSYISRLLIPSEGQVADERQGDQTLIHELEALVTALRQEAGFEAASDHGEGGGREGCFADKEGMGAELVIESVLVQGALPYTTRSPTLNLEQILRQRGRRMLLEQAMRIWAVSRGHQRIGKNIREKFDRELAAFIEQGKLDVTGDHVTLI